MIWLVAVFLALIPSALSSCGGSIRLRPDSPSTTFSVPTNSNGYHETPISCKWQIAAPPSATELQMTCKIHTGRSSSCSSTSFSFTKREIRRILCGRGKLTRTIPYSWTIVEFSSSLSSNNQYKGATCTVSYTPASGSDTSGNEDTTGEDTCTCGYKGGRRIVGGNEATPNEYPWQALLASKSGHQFCGGSLISNQWILTAAHCVDDKSASSIRVSLGEHDYSSSDSSTQKIEVEKIIIHKSYTSGSLVHDIALLKLKTPATINRVVSTICLPFNYQDVNLSGQTGTVSGWGLTKHGDYGSASKVLKEVDLKFIDNMECSSKYVWVSYQVTPYMICGLKENAGSCQGDSGGPFVWQNPDNSLYFQMGVVSFGANCAQNNAPSVFTKVQEYVDWIKENTGATAVDGLCTKK